VKRALISGITGQDGSYMAELLLEKGYEVHGLVRRVALEDPENRLGRIRHLSDRAILHPASLESFPSVLKVVSHVCPDECYHFAAASFVSYSFDEEAATLTTNITGTHNLLAAIQSAAPRCRFYFAGSSEMFGRAEEAPQTEETRFRPRSAYGISKVAGYQLVSNYREAYNLHASCGILYNHESPRRGFEFVTRKITSHVAKIKLGLARKLVLGDLDAQRDWGDAREYVKAIWLMVQQPKGDDYVIATGELRSVRQFLEAAFSYAGLDYRGHVEVDSQFVRPRDKTPLVGDAAKARKALGWHYDSSFEKIVRDMVDADMARLSSSSPTLGGSVPRQGSVANES
jgi:GDPmannose 4,6-dehydratase